MSDYINQPLVEEDHDFNVYSLSIEERIEIGKNTSSTENGGIITFPPNWVDIIPRRFKGSFARVPGELKYQFPYKTADGQVIVTIYRFEAGIFKEMRPVTRTGDDDYAMRNIGGMLPLFNLDIMAQRPDTPVIVVEGEKTAMAAAELFPDMVSTTFMCGVNGVHRTEMHALDGREVILWPDNDEAGRQAMRAFAAYALKAGAKSVRIVEVPADFPEKWDLADAPPEGLAEGTHILDLVDSAKPVLWTDVQHYARSAHAEAMSTRLLSYPPGYSKVPLDAANSALAELDPDMKKAPWMRIARAFYYAFGPAGLATFDEWSKGGDKYRKGEPASMWRSFEEERRFHALPLAWLFRTARREAKANGRSFELEAAAATLAAVEEVNQAHAVVVRGGKTAVLHEYFDPALDRYAQTYLTKADFMNKHVGHVCVPEGDNQRKSRTNTTPLGSYWFNSPWRRQYDGVYFAPGRELGRRQLNLWRGFPVDPIDHPEGWSRLKDHILQHICGGDQASFDYIMNWLAFGVQRLDAKPGTALVLIGPKGAGKSLLMQMYGRLFGQHFFVTAHDDDIVGRFNGRLEHTLLLGLEEVVAPQNRRSDGIIKDMITRPLLRLEDKFFSTWEAPNHLRIIMTSNNEHVVRADGIERRYAVFDVTSPFGDDADARTRYFSALVSQMDDGGTAAMLGELQSRDIRGWNPEALPKTDALQRQKQFSVGQNPVHAWYYDRLQDGISPVGMLTLETAGYRWSERSPVDVPSRTIIEDYRLYAAAHGFAFRERQFCVQLGRLLPPGFGSVTVRSKNPELPPVHRAYRFPPLHQARAMFTKKTGLLFEEAEVVPPQGPAPETE